MTPRMRVPRDIVITNVCGSRENMIPMCDASRLAKHITLGHRRNDFFFYKNYEKS